MPTGDEFTFWLELETVDTEAAEFRSDKNPTIFSMSRAVWGEMGKPIKLTVKVQEVPNAL